MFANPDGVTHLGRSQSCDLRLVYFLWIMDFWRRVHLLHFVGSVHQALAKPVVDVILLLWYILGLKISGGNFALNLAELCTEGLVSEFDLLVLLHACRLGSALLVAMAAIALETLIPSGTRLAEIGHLKGSKDSFLTILIFRGERLYISRVFVEVFSVESFHLDIVHFSQIGLLVVEVIMFVILLLSIVEAFANLMADCLLPRFVISVKCVHYVSYINIL